MLLLFALKTIRLGKFLWEKPKSVVRGSHFCHTGENYFSGTKCVCSIPFTPLVFKICQYDHYFLLLSV